MHGGIFFDATVVELLPAEDVAAVVAASSQRFVHLVNHVIHGLLLAGQRLLQEFDLILLHFYLLLLRFDQIVQLVQFLVGLLVTHLKMLFQAFHMVVDQRHHFHYFVHVRSLAAAAIVVKNLLLLPRMPLIYRRR